MYKYAASPKPDSAPRHDAVISLKLERRADAVWRRYSRLICSMLSDLDSASICYCMLVQSSVTASLAETRIISVYRPNQDHTHRSRRPHNRVSELGI